VRRKLNGVKMFQKSTYRMVLEEQRPDRTFKPGVGLLVAGTSYPVVPCYLTGFNKVNPKGKRGMFEAPCSVSFLKPIYFEPGTEVSTATRMIYDALNTVHHRVHQDGPDAASRGLRPSAALT
jgi:1-acyl-sn-glycerol-3-phosphate acyltransferase